MKYFSDAVDRLTGGLRQITTDHVYIHDGRFFTAESFPVIATGGSYTFGFTAPLVPKGIYIHYRPAIVVSSVDKLTISFYKGSVFTGGTPLTANNHNLNFALTNKFVIVGAPTVTTQGALIQQTYIPGSTGVGGTRSGGLSSLENEWVLVPGAQYLGIFANGSLDANKVAINFQWYEEGA